LDDWNAWKDHLARRKSVPTLEILFPGTPSPLCWGLPREVFDALDSSLTQSKGYDSLSEEAGSRWRQGKAGQEIDCAAAMEALAWCHALPALAQSWPEASWRGLWEELQRLASDATALQPADQPLLHALLAVELPITLAYWFPELPVSGELQAVARKLLSWEAEEATDGEGMLPGRHLPLLGGLLATWTRMIALFSRLAARGADEDVQAQYAWLVRQTLRLLRDDKTLVFTPAGRRDDFDDLLAAALAFCDDAPTRALAQAALEGAKAPSGKGQKKDKRKAKGKDIAPEPFVYSQWSGVGLLRGDWQRGAPRLAVRFDERRVNVEIQAEGKLLVAGDWQCQIEIDGWKWQPAADWEEVCWHADDDVVYLELETRLTDGWTLQRHLLLAREDQFLLAADAVLGAAPAAIQYRTSLPLADGIHFLPADQTREGYLTGKRAHALVLPLELAEWRSQPSGELRQQDGNLVLEQQTQGQRLFAPLFIDLSPSRLRKECTWRKLTVAHQLQIQPTDLAVAYRAQVGKHQWAFYRSLGPKANRTFLGQNLVAEFQASRFLSDGNTKVLLEIE
jgi:hypothetical protein